MKSFLQENLKVENKVKRQETESKENNICEEVSKEEREEKEEIKEIEEKVKIKQLSEKKKKRSFEKKRANKTMTTMAISKNSKFD